MFMGLCEAMWSKSQAHVGLGKGENEMDGKWDGRWGELVGYLDLRTTCLRTSANFVAIIQSLSHA